MTCCMLLEVKESFPPESCWEGKALVIRSSPMKILLINNGALYALWLGDGNGWIPPFLSGSITTTWNPCHSPNTLCTYMISAIDKCTSVLLQRLCYQKGKLKEREKKRAKQFIFNLIKVIINSLPVLNLFFLQNPSLGAECSDMELHWGFP